MALRRSNESVRPNHIETPIPRDTFQDGSPALLKLEQEGAIASEWGPSENNRRARFYSLTTRGRKQLHAERQNWEQTMAVIGRFFDVKSQDLP